MNQFKQIQQDMHLILLYVIVHVLGAYFTTLNLT